MPCLELVPITKTILLGATLAVFAVSMFALGNADAVSDFLSINKATVSSDATEFTSAQFIVKGPIPEDGSGNAFGYGVISGSGLEAFAVTTTHAGVLDSVAQNNDASNPVFHNHYVALQNSQLDDNGTELCPGLEVRDITFEEPGDVNVKSNKATMVNVPLEFEGTHSLFPEVEVDFSTDGDAGMAVSFTIDPVDGDGKTSLTDIQAVCINDVAPAKHLK